MRWEVNITGDPSDLRTLCDIMQDDDTLICERDNGFVLCSTKFNRFQDANHVCAYAQKIVTSLSGISRLFLGALKPIRLGPVIRIRDDGTKNIFVQLKSNSMLIRALPITSFVTRSDGTVQYHGPANSVKDWLKIAQQNPSVAKALRLRNRYSLTWVNLYRIYEVIEGDVGRSHIVKSEWGKNAELDHFKHTANSVRACGDQARHGKEKNQPPTKPMSLSHAKTLVDKLLKAWIKSKSSIQSK